MDLTRNDIKNPNNINGHESTNKPVAIRITDETNEKIQELLAIKRSVHQAHLAQMSPCEESHLLSCMQQPPAQTK